MSPSIVTTLPSLALSQIFLSKHFLSPWALHSALGVSTAQAFSSTAPGQQAHFVHFVHSWLTTHFAIDASGAKQAGLECQDKYSVATQKVDLERQSAAAMSFLLLWTQKTDCSIPLCRNVVIYANAVIIISCQLPSENVIPVVLI